MAHTLRDDPNFLFTLHVPTSEGKVVIHAYENPSRAADRRYGHTYVDLHVRMKGEDVFPRGSLWVGIPSHASIDGKYAQEAALSCVCMKPGDTDADYFKDYTDAQREFAESLGEEMYMYKLHRFGEE